MHNSKIIKIISAALIFAQIIWALPFLADAQLGLCGDTPLNPCYTNDFNTGTSAFGSGAVTNITALSSLSVFFNTYQAALTTVQGVETANHAAQLGLNAASLLTDNSPLVGELTTVLGAYTTFLGIARAQLLLVNSFPAPNTYISSLKQQYSTQMSNTIQIYASRQDNLQARLKTAQQSFWKTLLISILLQTSKAVADTLVTKLVNNYKISNLKQYADSAATLMYDNQFIRQNFPNAQDQLMARAIISNPLFRTQIQPGIFVAANAALGYNPAAMNPASPNFYGQMAAMGSPSANPYYLQTAYVGSVDQSRAASLATAQQQISQGSGYKAPVNCAGTLVQQQQIDSQALALQNQLNNREQLFNNLSNAQKAGQNVSSADLIKAQMDLNAATNTWNNAPKAVTSGAGSTSTDPAIIMCEAISSPAILVNQGINSMFNSLSNGALAQYNSNNLPAYINMMSGVISQIGTSMVLGGASGAAHSALVNENQTVAATAALAGSIAATNSTANLGNSPIIFYNSGTDSQNRTTLSWNVITTQLTTASYVTIAGPGAPAGHQPLTGSATVSPTSSTSYALTVFDPTGKNLGSSYLAVLSNPQQSLNYNPNAPAVAGAFTAKPAIQPRGPAPELSVR